MTVIRYILAFAGLLFFCSLNAQKDTLTISGTVKNEQGQVISYANIGIESTKFATVSDEKGKFRLSFVAGSNMNLLISHISFSTKSINLDSLLKNNIYSINVILEPKAQDIEQVDITGSRKGENMMGLDMNDIEYFPSVSGNLESTLKIFGAASSNELSSQYSVRGGNFDENLIYVNDVEIFRPFLVRSGQQEGLSFINPDLVSSLNFSAGGFDATYGDKMSSVLDIKYKKPRTAEGSFSSSILGGSLSFGDISKNKKLSHITGLRYKTNKYLVGTLDTKGEYNPSAADLQSYISWNVTNNTEINFLGNYSINNFDFVPDERETSFGTIQQMMKMKIYYDGNEKDRFRNMLGALTVSHKRNNYIFKLIGSAYNSTEQETYDISGQYLINLLDNMIGSDNFGDSLVNIGIGTFINHARNYLNTQVYSVEHKGVHFRNNGTEKWGIKYQYQHIDSKISEWDVIDSAGYSIPDIDNSIPMYNTRKSKNILASGMVMGYAQKTIIAEDAFARYTVTSGIRSNYWNYNNRIQVTPRILFSMKPKTKQDITLRSAIGMYFQPLFYHELITPDGTLYDNLTENETPFPKVRSQKSYHFLLGGDLKFESWGRPFIFTTELFYKLLRDQIPYKIENIRIQYYPAIEYQGDTIRLVSDGYVAGIDFRINGEFVKNAQSWASLSLMKAREDIRGDYYIDNGKSVFPGYFPRPTDQILNFALYFQDYLPNMPEYKVHLQFYYASGLPVSRPNTKRLSETFRLPAYKRLDIGFSRLIKKESQSPGKIVFFNHFKEIWISAEVFNLLGVNNTVSYMWVKTVSNTNLISGWFAVPNYLTSRRFNLRLQVNF